MKLIWIEGTSGEVREVAHAMITPSGGELLGVVFDHKSPDKPLPEIKSEVPKIAMDNGHVSKPKKVPKERKAKAVVEREPRQLKSPVAAKRSDEFKQSHSDRMKEVAANRQPMRPIKEIDAAVLTAIEAGCNSIGKIHNDTKISWGTCSNSVSRLISAGRVEETDDGLFATNRKERTNENG